ncbi:ATP-binding protein [Pseudomaricurvus sp. HS19]|uniref:ATP-binding protein n=1 Tax=Pseudomaricurvus sp. HS19 TaxID=2692626 RepID=UPI00136FEE7B|nr:ATP-binding protein [Pseudomaricurvus sp. HS19]MYM62582.1 HAMP domain-containing protein [Pseudomaricurvus sp. HS19]
MKFNLRAINRLSVKIFVGFWLVTIAMLVGSNLIVHFLDLGPNKHFSGYDRDRAYGAGDRLLREVVSDAVNYDYEQVEAGIRSMPNWVTYNFYLVNPEDKDLLQRPLPPNVNAILHALTEESPFSRQHIGDVNYQGRLFRLSDGTPMRLVVLSPKESYMGWRMFLSSFWHILLLDILISGAACFYLAKYITVDIGILKEATKRIAQGDWNVRVADELHDRPGEIGELGQAFDNMAAKLQQSMLEQKRLIKDVSHELRSPLARLQVALAIAQQRANSEITGELERIKHAADYLNDVISEILALPIAEQGDWELNDVVDLCTLINGIVTYNREEAALKSVTIKLVDHLGESLIASRSSTLAGVFDNIMRNAVRYTHEGTTITVILKRAADGQSQVIVSDGGPGVADEHLQDIFEPFFRTDEARDRKSGGYGLGLAIAKRTVVLHGGRIHAENNSGGGLRVVVSLPEIPGDDSRA